MRRLATAVVIGLLSGCLQDSAPPAVGPEPDYFVPGTYDRARGRLLIYAPRISSTPDVPRGTWAFDGQTWTREDAFGPSVREAPGMVFDEARGHTVLFGGEQVADFALLDDTQAYAGAGWAALDASGPVGRHSPAIAYDPGRAVTWMYGGHGTCVEEECQVLWYLDATGWHRHGE